LYIPPPLLLDEDPLSSLRSAGFGVLSFVSRSCVDVEELLLGSAALGAVINVTLELLRIAETRRAGIPTMKDGTADAVCIHNVVPAIVPIPAHLASISRLVQFLATEKNKLFTPSKTGRVLRIQNLFSLSSDPQSSVFNSLEFPSQDSIYSFLAKRDLQSSKFFFLFNSLQFSLPKKKSQLPCKRNVHRSTTSAQ